MSNLTYFAQRQWQKAEQRQMFASNIAELLQMEERLKKIAQTPHHWKASPKILTACKRLQDAREALQMELDE